MTSSTTTTDATARAPRPVGWRWAPHWVLAFVILWPAPGYAEGVMVLGALIAIVRLLRARFREGDALLSPQAWALTTVLFCAYWLPEVVSVVGAVDPARTVKEALVDTRYLPFLWLVAAAVADRRGRRITLSGMASIVAVWTLDAILEGVLGVSPLFWGLDSVKLLASGTPSCTMDAASMNGRLTGMLGPCNLKLGLVLASLSPFLLYAAGRRFGVRGWVVATAALGIVILLAGARAAWLTFALVIVFSGWRLIGWKRLLLILALGAATLAVLTAVSPHVQERVSRTASLLSQEPDGADVALSGRARIWSSAVCMAQESPVNGVGVRGFRAAFGLCDPQREAAAEWGEGPALHAHQIVLEVVSETGIVGLLMWLAGAAMAWRAWRYADASARERARPAMLALAVTVFPLNTHLAFYSTFWGGLTLLLAALYAGSLLAKPGTETHLCQKDVGEKSC